MKPLDIRNCRLTYAFIDYFRYTTQAYGTGIDITKVALSRKLNDDFELYRSKLFNLSNFDNFIPVISIKPGFYMSPEDLKELMKALKKSSKKIALRITDDYVNDYADIMIECLDETDYLLFDIGEQSPEVKFMELTEIEDLQLSAQVILLNSPRKAKNKNGDFPENGYTDLIDNCALEKFDEYGFVGYGDYCGLKDTLPDNGGGNGTGAALALIYDHNENKFWAYTNKNTKEGMKGYYKLIPIILSDRDKFDPSKTCSGYQKILSIENSGNWSTWLNVCMRRYISQVHDNLI
ncbi:MAG: hypothetical protein JXR88_14045 [Clostridia bacterium]|nr:hypothetical protein [Clostridia bacterium]